MLYRYQYAYIMKNSLLLFTIKCSVILYFAACTGINDYSKDVSATPQVTRGTWKVNLFTAAENDKTSAFKGYTLTFEPTGKITASKNGQMVTGNWAEDDILKRITISLDTRDPALTLLNSHWGIAAISTAGLSLQDIHTDNQYLQITSL